MKYHYIPIMLFSSLIFLCGCATAKQPQESTPPASPLITVTPSPVASETHPPQESAAPTQSASTSVSLKDYYPIQANTKYYYEGIGNEYATYDVMADYTNENAVQERVSNGGTVSARVIRFENGAITSVFSQGETYYRENLLKKNDDNTEILLKEPLLVGTTWVLSDGRTRTITNLSADVDTPLGTYKALEVTTQGPEDNILDYYVKDIGLVKSIFQYNDSDISSTLNKIEKNASLSQEINFYYPKAADENLYSVTKTVRFHTNDNTKQLLANAYKETDSSVEPVFTENTKINSLYLNNDGAVYLDLNRAFLTERNNSHVDETIILKAVAQTFGEYYNAQKLLLTIENKPYQTDALTMKKGEYLSVEPQGAR